MIEEEIEPKVKKVFFIKNIFKILRLQLSNRDKINNFIAKTNRLEQPLLNLFEGTGGPMEEGMIYLLFDADNGSANPKEFDTVFRIFWILAPDLNYHQIDSFVVSANDKVKSNQWRRFSRENIFENLSKTKFHQEVNQNEIEFEFDGSWESGYNFVFNDKLNHLSGKLRYNPISPKGTLVYYNGREAVAPQLLQKFYDSFAIDVSGSINFGDHSVNLEGARGIIEHGLGIFSIENIYEWRWLNLQSEFGSIHLFYHPITLNDESDIIEAGEGAALIDDNWYHFLIDDFVINELEYQQDRRLPTKIPNKWNVRAGFKSLGEDNQLDLTVEKVEHHSWQAEATGTTRHFTANFLLRFEGSFMNNPIQGTGTMEYLFERVIE